MESRIDFRHAPPEAVQAMMGLDKYVRNSDLEPALLELVRMPRPIANQWVRILPRHALQGRPRRRRD